MVVGFSSEIEVPGQGTEKLDQNTKVIFRATNIIIILWNEKIVELNVSNGVIFLTF